VHDLKTVAGAEQDRADIHAIDRLELEGVVRH
jgi:hypothetical protein